VQPLRDLRDIWVYSRTNRIGAFFDDESANGKFSELVSRYPGYRGFIEPLAVRASDDRILYPTVETRSFLLAIARGGEVRAVGPVPVPSFEPPRTSRDPAPVIPSGASRVEPATARDGATTISTPPAPTCSQPLRIDAIELSRAGLTVRATGSVVAKITATESVGDEGFGAFTNVTVEIPFAELGTASSRVTSEEGPFASLRAVRYQTSTDCGVRIRLQARTDVPLVVVSSPNAVRVAPEEDARRTRSVAVGVAEEGKISGGSARAAATYFGAKSGDSVSYSGEARVGFATNLAGLGTLRGFASQGLPRQETGGFFAGLALSGFYVASVQTEIGAGDLSVPVGGGQAASSINSLTIRGGAVSIFPGPTSMTVFGGRAATPFLRRLFGTREIVDISNDRVFGATGSRVAGPRQFGFAAALIRSMPRVGGAYTNLVEAVQTPGGLPYGARIVAEQSFVEEGGSTRRGYAWTIEPRAATKRVSLGGFYRYTSPEFHAPLSSTFFATLRRSYSAYGTYRPTDRLSAAIGLSQAKTFSLFDEPTIGTLVSSVSSSVSYRFSDNAGVSASYSEGSAKSDPGVFVGADSRTRSAGAGVFVSRPRWTYGLYLTDNVSRDYNQGTEFMSRRADANATFAPRDALQWYGRAFYGMTDSSDGVVVGSDAGLSAGVHTNSRRYGALRGEAGFSATPRGVTVQDTRQFFATLGYSPPTSLRMFDGHVQLTFQSVRVDALPPRNVVSLGVTLGRLLEWGEEPRPIAPYESRALSLGQPVVAQPQARLRIIAFEDLNGDSEFQSGEPPVENINVHVDDFQLVTSESGDAAATLGPGMHRIRLNGGLSARGFVTASSVDQEINLRPGARREILLPLQAAGRIVGSLRFEGEVPDDVVFTGIRITVRGKTTFDSITAGPEVHLGMLPVGEYEVILDRSTLSFETRLVGENVARVVVGRNARVVVTFTLRRATARERLVDPTPEL
jgi:hypothetical protein